MFATLNAALSPAGRGARLSILIFHRVRPRVDPLFPGEPDALQFEAKMRAVARDWTVLPLPQAVALLREGALPARALSITFDDGYADNFSVALPILKRLRLPATFFISTGFWDGQVMWNDAVVEAIRGTRKQQLDVPGYAFGMLDVSSVSARRASIGRLLAAMKYLPPAERDRAVAAVVAAARVPPARDLMLRAPQVVALARAGMSIGAHTVSHPILARLTIDQARDEIAQSRTTLENLLQNRVGLFAYPNGKPQHDFSPDHVAALRDMGFDAACTTVSGTAQHPCDLMQLPRHTPWHTGALRFRTALAMQLVRGGERLPQS